VDVGWFVKLIFHDPNKQGVCTERMWVKTTGQLVDGKYQGTIANDPVGVDALYDDVVVFEPRHIINILNPSDEDNG
jgi:hypothetical protein